MQNGKGNESILFSALNSHSIEFVAKIFFYLEVRLAPDVNIKSPVVLADRSKFFMSVRKSSENSFSLKLKAKLINITHQYG